jgi:hypothetical protein
MDIGLLGVIVANGIKLYEMPFHVYGEGEGKRTSVLEVHRTSQVNSTVKAYTEVCKQRWAERILSQPLSYTEFSLD